MLTRKKIPAQGAGLRGVTRAVAREPRWRPDGNRDEGLRLTRDAGESSELWGSEETAATTTFCSIF